MNAVTFIWLLVTHFHTNRVYGIFQGDLLERPFLYFARVVTLYNERNAHAAKICGGTIIRSNLVLTARSCVAHALRIHVITSNNDSKSDAAENVFEATVQPMKTVTSSVDDTLLTKPQTESPEETLYRDKLAILRLNSRVEERNVLRFCRDTNDVLQPRMVSVNPDVTGNFSVFYADMTPARQKLDLLFDWQPVEMDKCFGLSDVGNPVFGIRDVDLHDCLHSVVTQPTFDHMINYGNFRAMEALQMTRRFRKKMIDLATISIANDLHSQSSANENPSASSDYDGPSTSRGKTQTWSNEVKVKHIPKIPKRQFRSETETPHLTHSELIKHVVDKLNDEKKQWGLSCKGRSSFRNLAPKF